MDSGSATTTTHQQTTLPFPQRLGFRDKKLVDSDFPKTARIALFNVLQELVRQRKIDTLYVLLYELRRTCRMHEQQEVARNATPDMRLRTLLERADWMDVFSFCERIYEKLLSHDWVNRRGHVIRSTVDVRADFEAEMNQILAEENIAFEFRTGEFVRPGRPHTQKVISEAHKVLRLPELEGANLHYTKAIRFFSRAIEPDFPNAVKEAVSSLEAAAKGLFPEFRKLDLDKLLRRLQGTDDASIPPTIVNSIRSVYAFRGSAALVAHGGASGGDVSAHVAELVISLCATFITYLAGLQERRKIRNEIKPQF